MADRTSLRSLNRRNAPQSPPKFMTSTSPQRPATRVTRSRSHNVSDSETGRMAGRGGRRGRTRQASGESVQSTESRASQAEKGTKRGARARTANELSVVAEDSNALDPELGGAYNRDDGTDDDAAVQNQLRRETTSPGAVSAVSGTTVRTSHSAQELVELDPESMLDALPDLLRASNKVLNLLAPQNADEAHIIRHAKELRDPGSRASKNLHRLERTFQLQRDLYGTEQYINVILVLRKLLDVRRFEEVGSGPWRPDGVLQMANLATLAMTFLPARMLDPIAHSGLEKLGRDFPTPFLFETEATQTGSVASMGNSGMAESTFPMALEVRTQVFTMLATQHRDNPNFDPEDILKQVFFDGDKAVKGWDTPGLRGEELSKQQVQVIMQRIEEIRRIFSENPQSPRTGGVLDLERLSASFSWSSFMTKLAAWCRMRQDEIQAQLEYQGGLENIVQALGDEIKRRAALLTFDAQGEATDGLVQINYDQPPAVSEATSDQNEPSTRVPPGTGKPKKPRSSFKSPIVIAHLKRKLESKLKPAMHQQVPEVAINSQPTATQPHITGSHRTTSRLPSTTPAKSASDRQARQQSDDGWRPDLDDGGNEPMLNSDPYNEQRLQLANRERFDLENNKENIEMRPSATMAINKKPSFIDAQANAKRISFDSSQQSHQPVHPTKVGRSRQPVEKLEYVPEGDEVGEPLDSSEDEDFENDSRVHDIQRKRNAASVRKRPVTRTAEQPAAGRKRPRHVVNDDEEDEEEARAAADQHNRSTAPRPSSAQIYKKANDQAKFLVATKKSKESKRVQRRNAWSEEETEAFIEYIETKGTSWALILNIDKDKEDGKVLQSRDQVALKDKARNMKMDFLKVGDHMPKNFERIALSKPQIEALSGLGVLYNERTGRRAYDVSDEDESGEI